MATFKILFHYFVQLMRSGQVRIGAYLSIFFIDKYNMAESPMNRGMFKFVRSKRTLAVCRCFEEMRTSLDNEICRQMMTSPRHNDHFFRTKYFF